MRGDDKHARSRELMTLIELFYQMDYCNSACRPTAVDDTNFAEDRPPLGFWESEIRQQGFSSQSIRAIASHTSSSSAALAAGKSIE